MNNEIRVGEYTDESARNAMLQISLEQLQQAENLLVIALLFGVVWFVLYTWAMWRCVTCLKNKHHAIWSSLKKPTVLSGNMKVISFAFGKKMNEIAAGEKWQFSVLRWLAMIGVVYVLVLIVMAIILL